MLVRELRLPVVTHPASSKPLYPHQVAVWDGWQRHSAMLLAAKTGTGKTRAAMLPILKRREWGLAVYPTNELIRDQVRAVARFAQEEGIEPLVLTPQEYQASDWAERYSRAEHVLVPVDGGLLDQWQEVMHCRARGETLRRLLNPDKPKIIFTNPDIVFLILALQYHAEPFEALHRYETLVIDEFHLYHGVELAHSLVMVALARGFGIFRRLVLLSATPHHEVSALLERSISPEVIGSQIANDSEWRQRRIAVHEVQVEAVQVTGGDTVDTMLPRIVALKPALERLRRENADDNYLPAVVILNSVVNAIYLEDRLVKAGFSRESLAIIRGLSHRAIRDTRGKLLALGTSAIEVGVDFHCDVLLFEASEAASFLQRFGRVGRHRPGKAIALVPPNAFQGMMAMPSEVDRATFEERIHAWYPSATARPWFVTTKNGMITARTICENMIATAQRDGNTRPQVLVQLRDKVDGILSDHAARLGCQAENLQAKSAFERSAAGKSGVRWLGTYCRLNRFRTSLPSVRVRDFSEQHRRQEWGMGEYDADLATLLKRAVGLAWNDKLGMLTIRGLGRYHQVHASPIFSGDDCGFIVETRDCRQLRLYQDGESTPVSDLMARENHVFAVVPKAGVHEEIDWRLAVFEAGDFLVAFDGAALLLVEVWRRWQRSSRDAGTP